MILVPAIDISGGRAVRLRQGDFDRETVYADDPVAAARDLAGAGARRLHVVDLDGARRGSPAALDHLRRIADEVAIPIQYGGGLRKLDAVAAALEAGADRVVLGTAALSDDGFLAGALERFGERVAAAVDARAGEVTVAGWERGTGTRPETVVRRLAVRGVRRLVYTDVDRDGMLEGPALRALRDLAAGVGEGVRITYSGGIGSLGDLRSLAALALPAVEAVISGRALYERRFTVAEGQAALDSPAAA